MLQNLCKFLKKPVYSTDENTAFKYRLNILFRLLVFALATSMILSAILGGIQNALDLDLGKHAIESMLDNHSPAFLLFAAVILAPLLEELIFRGPMVLFNDKPYFNIVFYVLTAVFGFYHITNFEITTTILILAPLLVAPQISVGAILGYIRVRFGLQWSIALHALYNFMLIGPILLLQLLDIPIE